MWKLFKSRKALSPVVAAIILIAVTVAVSIAVAAWMGALTFTFMKTEELKVLGGTWTGTPATYMTLSVKDTGSSALTISQIRLNNVANASMTAVPLNAGATASLRVTAASFSLPSNQFSPGTKYEFEIFTATGNQYQYVDTAP